jgi:hypothetical protein
MGVQVRQETTTRLVVRVRYIVANGGAFTRHLTDFGHDDGLQKY